MVSFFTWAVFIIVRPLLLVSRQRLWRVFLWDHLIYLSNNIPYATLAMLQRILVDKATKTSCDCTVVKDLLLNLGEFVKIEGTLTISSRHLHVSEFAGVWQDSPGLADHLLSRLPIIVRVWLLYERYHFPPEESVGWHVLEFPWRLDAGVQVRVLDFVNLLFESVDLLNLGSILLKLILCLNFEGILDLLGSAELPERVNVLLNLLRGQVRHLSLNRVKLSILVELSRTQRGVGWHLEELNPGL